MLRLSPNPNRQSKSITLKMASMPHEIITEILCRLGVEDLLRCRCVSKRWRSLIDSPDFIKHHLSHSLKSNTRLFFLLRDRGLRSVNFESLETAQILHHSLQENDEYYTPKILTSCNGLVVLRGDRLGEKLALWNPSTRKSIMLPVSKFESCWVRFIVYGLGFDPISDDYKLVRMAQLDCSGIDDDDNDDSFGSEVQVYSLKSNSWRRTKDLPYYLTHEQADGILASNALHWVVSKNPQLDTCFIAAFDLGTEEYRLVELPDSLGTEFETFENSDTELQELHLMKAMGDCLCMLVSYWKVDVIDIWVMTRYGVKESWTWSVTVKQPGTIWSTDWPLAFSRTHDQLLLKEDDKLILWYDLRKKIVKRKRWIAVSSSFQVEMMVASLVPLHGAVAQ